MGETMKSESRWEILAGVVFFRDQQVIIETGQLRNVQEITAIGIQERTRDHSNGHSGAHWT